jgi:hypothetical protein
MLSTSGADLGQAWNRSLRKSVMMLSLLVIVVALLCVNLFALTGDRVVVRLPFALAACALLIALLAPFAGVLKVPLPSQFLLLWLLIIPIAVVGAVACTLIGLLIQAEYTLLPGSPMLRTGPPRRGSGLPHLAFALAPIAVILVVAGAELVLPVRLFTMPVLGIETSMGTVSGGTRYGATFAGSVSGSLDGTLTASADYRPAFPGPGVTNRIVGGSWSLAVYKDGRFQGVLFGPLASGTVRWNPDDTEATTTTVLTVDGGTGAYLGAHGSATLTGNLLHLTYPPTVGGSLTLHLR